MSNAGMTSTSGDLVALSFDTGIATLQLERPDARNALSLDMIEQMHDALARIASTQDLRVMVLCGSGKSFCAGMYPRNQGLLKSRSQVFEREIEVSCN